MSAYDHVQPFQHCYLMPHDNNSRLLLMTVLHMLQPNAMWSKTNHLASGISPVLLSASVWLLNRKSLSNRFLTNDHESITEYVWLLTKPKWSVCSWLLGHGTVCVNPASRHEGEKSASLFSNNFVNILCVFLNVICIIFMKSMLVSQNLQ